jgi:hypothetical protein
MHLFEVEENLMISQVEIYSKLNSLISHDLSLPDFEDWLVEKSWNMHKNSDPAAVKLVSAIELRLAEWSSGHLSEESMRKEFLSMLVGHVVLQMQAAHVRTCGEFIPVVTDVMVEQPSPQGAGKQFLTACVL